MDVVELDSLTDDQRAAMGEGEEDPFGNEGDGPGLEWREKDLYLALRDADDRLVARAGLLIADGTVAGRPVTVVGLGDVLVAPSRRRRGLAVEVTKAALERARGLGPELIMLFCDESNVGLYRRAGFRLIHAPVRADQPDGPVEMPMRAMWASLREDAAWPGGDVVLGGRPF